MTRIRELRELYGFTQDSVAEAIDVSRITYIRYENDMRTIKGPELLALATLYHVSVDFLLDNTEDDKKTPIVIGDGLKSTVIDRVKTLSIPELQRVLDFLSGLKAGREIEAAQSAPPDPSPEPDV